MKIYTRTGDKGETSLSSGTRVGKDHPRLEAYGSVDELNAHLGLIRSMITDPVEQKRITAIQKRVFVVSSSLALDESSLAERLPKILDEDIIDLELAIDRMMGQMPPLRNFVLPAGHVAVAQCHVARTVCRRAERAIIRLSRQIPVDLMLIRYVNRLSDYLFVLARKCAFDLGVGESVWTADFRDAEG